MDSSLIGTNEKLNIIGDYNTAVKYVPFARKKLKEIIESLKRLGLFFDRKFYILNDASITVEVRFNIGTITVESFVKKQEKKEDYKDGITRINIPENFELKEFYGKDSNGFVNLPGYDIIPSSFLTDLGYDTTTKTQHSFIKASKYTGLMKYAIQNLLGQNKQIGYNFGFEETDGLLLESISYSINNQQLQGNTVYYQRQQEIQLRNIKISRDGVFIRKASNKIIPNITLDYNNPGFCCLQDTNDTQFNSGGQIHENFRYFNQLLNKTDFNIPLELSDYIYDNETTYKLLDSTDLDEFYLKNSFFNSCGWLFTNDVSNYIEETTARGKEFEYTTNAFNTCFDTENSYLYGIQIKCRKVIFNDTFKASNEYQTNPKYIEQKNYIYEYTASLHKLLQGRLSNLTSSGLSFMEGNGGLYFPNEEENKCKSFTFGTLSLNETKILEFAPNYVINNKQEEVSGTNDLSINGINILEKFPKTITAGAIKCSGVMDIDVGSSRYLNYDTTIVQGIDNESMKTYINNNFKNIITNNAVVDFYYNSNTTEFIIDNPEGVNQTTKKLSYDVSSYTSYANNIGRQQWKYIYKHTYEESGSFSTILQVNTNNDDSSSSFISYAEKIIVPMDNRNSIVCVYNSFGSSDIINLEDNFNKIRYRYPISNFYIDTNGTIETETYNDTNMYADSLFFEIYDVPMSQFVDDFKAFERIYVYPTNFNGDNLNEIQGVDYQKEVNSLIYRKLNDYNESFYSTLSVFRDNTRSKYYFSQYIDGLIETNTEFIDIRLVLNVKNSMFAYYVNDSVNAISDFIRLYFDFNNDLTQTNYCYIENDVYSPVSDYIDMNFIGNP